MILVNLFSFEQMLFSFEQMLPDRSDLICSESWSDLILDILILLYKRYLIRTSKIFDLCSDQIYLIR